MANSYYSRTYTFAERTKARGTEVKAEYDALASGFDIVATDVKRALTMPTGTSVELDPVAGNRALRVIGFDANGDVELQDGIGSFLGDWATASDYHVRDVMVDSGGELGLDNVYICNTNHTSSAGLATDAANWDLMIDMTDVKTSEASAATSAANALASESLTAADLVITNANVVTTNADAATTTQDAIDTTANVGTTNANVVTTNADAATTTQDAIDTAADLVATNQDTIDTAADRIQTGIDRVAISGAETATAADVVLTHADVVITNADAASTTQDAINTAADANATAADLVATNQDTIDTAADLVATNQDTIDTAADVVTTGNNATTSTNAKNDAETARAAAELALDQFTDQYLGSKTSDPTLDNDGATLQAGALYWNTTANNMRVYDLGGTAWVVIDNYAHPNHIGDVTSVSDGATTIVNNAVTLAKMANISTASLLGRDTAGTGIPEVLSASVARTLLAVAGIETTNQYTEAQSVDLSTLTDAATIAWDLSAEQNAEVTLGADRLLGLPTNIVETTYVTLTVKQDATGTRLLTYNAAFDFGDDGEPTLSTVANKVDVLTFMTVGTTGLRFLGIKTGYSA